MRISGYCIQFLNPCNVIIITTPGNCIMRIGIRFYYCLCFIDNICSNTRIYTNTENIKIGPALNSENEPHDRNKH